MLFQGHIASESCVRGILAPQGGSVLLAISRFKVDQLGTTVD